MLADKYFKNCPKCYVIQSIPSEEEGAAPSQERVDGLYEGTVLEVVNKGSFLTNIHVGLIYVPKANSFIKVPLESINFE